MTELIELWWRSKPLREAQRDKLFEKGFEEPFTVELGAGKHGPLMDGKIVKIGLNEYADPASDIYWNLEQGIPLPDACVQHIHSNQTLEHIYNIIGLFNDMWRVLIPGGTMHHAVPHWQSVHAWGDPTHRRVFTEVSFQYFCQREDGAPFVQRFSDYGIECNFILTNQEIKPRVEIQAWFQKP